MRQVLIWSILFLIGVEAQAEVQSKSIDYRHGDTVLKGFLAYDDKAPGKRPGILVVHEWWGLNDYARQRAEMLAELGYVAFAVDMYGAGKTVTTAEEAGQLAGPFYQDIPKLRARLAAGLDVLKSQDNVDSTKLAAIGYCFGGTCCLQFALGGADLAGVVSFHGGLFTPVEAEAASCKARLLILHGADDPLIPEEQISSFQQVLRKAGTRWEMVSYGGAVHAFTNPGAGRVGIKGVAYHAEADRRSWQHMKHFFDELFAAAER
jgi:dienelactone hydrolase